MSIVRRFTLLSSLMLFSQAAAQDQAVTLVSPGDGPQQKLAYKFTPGQFLNYEVDHKMTFNVRYQQNVSKTREETQTWKQLRIVNVDESGNATLEPMISRVKMMAKFDAEPEITYDSQNNTEAPKKFAPVAEAIGKTYVRLQFAPNGELLRVAALPGAPEHLAEAATKPDAQYNFLIVFPKEPIGIGAIWKDRFQVPVTVDKKLSQQVSLQRQYTLTGIQGTTATITLKTSVITPINNPEVEGQLVQRTPNGIIEFDLERGVITSQTMSVVGQAVGAFGPMTALDASSTTHEKLVPAATAVQPAALKR